MESFVHLVSVSSAHQMSHLLKSCVSLRHCNHLSLLMSIGSFVNQVTSRLQKRAQCPSIIGSTVYTIQLFIFYLENDYYRHRVYKC